MTKTTAIRRMNLLRPDLYERLMKDQRSLNSIRKHPLQSYVLKMEQILPQILSDKELTVHEKMRRYTRIMNKLNSLTASHYKVEAVGAPLDENPATPPQADYKIQQPATLLEKPIMPPDYNFNMRKYRQRRSSHHGSKPALRQRKR